MRIVVKKIFLVSAIAVFSAFRITENKNDYTATPVLKIVKTWHLPDILKEISGIDIIDSVRLACIQDEMGIIFIYNTATSAIEEQIPFAPAGDFEGIAIVNKSAWVLRSDGKLFEVTSLTTKASPGKEYSTRLTAQQNVEGLCYDKKNNRLLLAIKSTEPGGKNYKGIYSFDLVTKTMATEPAYKISMQQEVVTGNKKRKFEIMPSDIAINPKTGDIYITDGRNAMLLILDAAGNFKTLYPLNTKEFHQPEGITFYPDGKMFISNEGRKEGGNILKVETVN